MSLAWMRKRATWGAVRRTRASISAALACTHHHCHALTLPVHLSPQQHALSLLLQHCLPKQPQKLKSRFICMPEKWHKSGVFKSKMPVSAIAAHPQNSRRIFPHMSPCPPTSRIHLSFGFLSQLSSPSLPISS